MKTHTIVGMTLIVILSAGPMLATADAGGEERSAEKSFRLYANGSIGPMGVLESLESVRVNGRALGGARVVWSGDLIEAPVGGVRLSLDSIGSVTLENRAIARLASVTGGLPGGKTGKILIASIIRGNMRAGLREDAGAYIECQGSAYIASGGAAFRVGELESKPFLTVSAGDVQTETPSPQRKYLIRPVGGRASISVKARSTVQIQFRVTDDHDKPVPDLPVIVAVAGSGMLGSGSAAGATVTLTTTSQGLVQVPFTAVNAASTSSITASVPGTNATCSMSVATTAAGGLSAAAVVAIVAAGVGGAVAAKKLTEDSPSPAQPPTFDKPKIRP